MGTGPQTVQTPASIVVVVAEVVVVVVVVGSCGGLTRLMSALGPALVTSQLPAPETERCGAGRERDVRRTYGGPDGNNC